VRIRLPDAWKRKKSISKNLADVSKFLSFVLRHKPDAIGIALDSEGWVAIADLIAAANHSGQQLDRSLIQSVVDSSDKKRFSISCDGMRIRAVQGHSAQSVE
jgi:putative RNA 2'-phosphotransferase